MRAMPSRARNRTGTTDESAKPAPRSRRSPKGKPSKPGRPSLYKAEYVRIARGVAMLGATDRELADVLGVGLSTIEDWKRDKPEFCNALKKGKAQADAVVASRLYARATGYSHKAVKIGIDAKTGAEHQVEYTERYPPDTTACIFWLKNRRPAEWRDRHELTGKDGQPLLETLVGASMANQGTRS